MKVIRILVYDGSDSFIRRSLEYRQVIGTKTITDGSVSEYFITGPLPIMEDLSTVIEALLPSKTSSDKI